MDTSKTQVVDRVANSYMLVRSMHHAVLDAGAEHFSRLVVLTPATSSKASSCLCGDPMTSGIAALQTAASVSPNPSDVRRDRPLLALIQVAGGELEYAVPLVRRLQETRDDLAIEVAELTGAEAGEMHSVLDDYAAWVEEGGMELNPLGFSAWRERRKAAK
jgi:hypothetical protein